MKQTHLSANGMLTHAEYLKYLERCAEMWERPPYNSPLQAEDVREKARHLQDPSACPVCLEAAV